MKKRKDLRIGLLQLLVFDGEFAAPMLPARAVGRASRRPSARAARLRPRGWRNLRLRPNPGRGSRD